MRRFGFFRDQLAEIANGPYTLFADAQATIAALQARVKELEESRDAWKASQECSEKAYMELVNQIPAERFDYDPVNVALLDGAKEQEIIGRKQIADLQGLLKRTDENREQWRKLCQEAQSQLTQRTAECDALKLVNDTHMKTVMKLSHVVEQRTAELEAANHSAQTFQTLWRESCNQRDELQAKLERVRADNKALDEWRADVTVSLQRPGGAFFVDVPQHIKDLVRERDELRTLVLALPKVEYEIKASNFIAHIWPDHDTEEPLVDLRASVAALLKHRQGMEG